MKTRVLAAALSVLLAGAATAGAQLRQGTVELNPYAGYLLGGEVFQGGSYAYYYSTVDVKDDLTYGGRIGWNATSLFELEFQYSHTATTLEAPVYQGSGGNVTVGDLTIDYFMGYATFNFGHGRLVPYFTIGAGAANLIPNVANTSSTSEVRFTASAGGGVKYFVTPHFGFRLDGRAYTSYLGDHSQIYCDTYNYCTTHTWLTNAEVGGGLIIAF